MLEEKENESTSKISQDLTPVNDYYKEDTKKDLIVVHMTGGGSYIGADETLDIPDKINTHFIVKENGEIVQRFPLNYWAHHVGFRSISKRSIGIELVGWCIVYLKNGKFVNYLNKEIDDTRVIELERYKGQKYFWDATDLQKANLEWLINNLCEIHDISKEWTRYPTTNHLVGLTTHHVIKPETRWDYVPKYPLLLK